MFFDSSQMCWNVKMYHNLYLLMKANGLGFKSIIVAVSFFFFFW